jgi:hypothetical protein
VPFSLVPYSLFLFSRGGRRGRKEDRSLLGKRSARHGNMALVIRMRREFVFQGFLAAALEKGRGISRSGFVGFRRHSLLVVWAFASRLHAVRKYKRIYSWRTDAPY